MISLIINSSSVKHEHILYRDFAEITVLSQEPNTHLLHRKQLKNTKSCCLLNKSDSSKVKQGNLFRFKSRKTPFIDVYSPFIISVIIYFDSPHLIHV
jgi:plasmid rolling circle replication initiator protein Rep